MKCSICNEEIEVVGTWTRGNNAQPVNDGRCCGDCNWMVVIPARIALMTKAKPKSEIPNS